MIPTSFGTIPLENPPTFPALEPEKNPQIRRCFVKTGLTKRQKTTAIYFDEHSDLIEVQTHNTELKKRLSKFAAMYPDHCRQTDDDDQGGLTFEIEKGRLSFRLTAPYSADRRKAASDYAKENGMKGSAGH
mgnify:CR=1 FL=1